MAPVLVFTLSARNKDWQYFLYHWTTCIRLVHFRNCVIWCFRSPRVQQIALILCIYVLKPITAYFAVFFFITTRTSSVWDDRFIYAHFLWLHIDLFCRHICPWLLGSVARFQHHFMSQIGTIAGVSCPFALLLCLKDCPGVSIWTERTENTAECMT